MSSRSGHTERRIGAWLCTGLLAIPAAAGAQQDHGVPLIPAAALGLIGLNGSGISLATATDEVVTGEAETTTIIMESETAEAEQTSTVTVENAAGEEASTVTTEPAADETSTITVETGDDEETTTITTENGDDDAASTITADPGAEETSTITVETGTDEETTTIITEEGDAETSTITTENPAAPAAPGGDDGSATTTITTAGGDAEELGGITVEGVWTPTQVGPQRGLKLTRDQLPANVQSATGEEIRESRATSLTDFMNQNMQSVTINEYSGNPFQADVQFRGFSASPQIGTPQGLSVFFDGIRVNEPFGDVVNWDLIPLNAIQTFDVFPGSNPLFGLNTLGGALSIRSKNGFEDAGVRSSLLGGSWGRIHGQLDGGGHYGPLGGFVAVTGFHEEGWRENSPSDVKQAFSKISLRNERVELDASMLLAGTDLIGNGLIPQELYDEDPTQVFTSPDETRNNLQQFSLSGLINVTDKFNITAQVYRRTSDRRAVGGDIYEGFDELNTRTDAIVDASPTEDRIPGFETCRFQDINHDGIPDYYLDASVSGDFDETYDPLVDGELNPIGLTSAEITTGGERGRLTFLPALNSFNCDTWQYLQRFNPDGSTTPRNGRDFSGSGTVGARGVVEGTPIGQITNTSIDQITEGAALQLNFNLDQHAFMVGASIDANESAYTGRQRLALIDENHNVFLAPEDIDLLYLAAREPITNNEFAGFSDTYSAYFSETWSPFDNLHLSFSGRYNYTHVKNNLTARANSDVGDLHEFRDFSTARPNSILCPGDDLASCPDEVNFSTVDSLPRIINNPDNLDERNRTRLLPTSEKYHYYSFNPSVGINFLPRPDANIFVNWSQGTRTPSIVELGCAYDPTLIDVNADGVVDAPAGIANPNGCTLPTTLGGDPFLPQVFARSAEIGMRGTFPNGWEWNGSVYRTNLFDDLYFVGGAQGQGNFQSIGDTRRQGFELGLGGPVTRWLDFKVNYGFTEATFQSQFYMIGERNSSRLFEGEGGGEIPTYNPDNFDPTTGKALVQLEDMIDVQPGDRLPGVPLHNLNVAVNLHPLERWDIGISMVAHSSAYVRGNENNDHQPGDYSYEDLDVPLSSPVRFRTERFTQSGKVDGYAIFNLKSSFELVRGVKLFGQINNLFDKEYYSAGRLGVNPFAPSVEGAIGPSGWNYNSSEWTQTTFVGPGAPRAYWIGLDVQF